jgi:signal peptidase I
MLFRLVIVLVIAAGVLAAALFGLTRQYSIASVGMKPTITKGDHIAVFRFSDWFYTPHRKDIVIFKAPPVAVRKCGRSGIVDRVIGLPGETVSEQIGRVSIDGKPLQEPYVKAARRDTHTAAWLVPNPSSAARVGSGCRGGAKPLLSAVSIRRGRRLTRHTVSAR